MSNKSIFTFLFLIIIISCKPQLQTNPNGLSWHYILNTQQVFYNNIVTYGSKITRYVETIHQPNGKIDSNYLSGPMVDWKPYIEPFLKINMNDTSFQGLYTMAQNIDTITNTVEITYLPTIQNLKVQKMVVRLNAKTSELQYVYADVQEVGAFTKQNKTLIFEPGKLIEIIENNHPFFGKEERSARQLHFIIPNNPKVEIIKGIVH